MGEALGISLPQIIFAILNFLILVGVLTKFLYKPFLEMLENRKQTIQDSFDNAAAVNKRADEKLANYDRRIANLEGEGREIVKNAKIKAETQAKDIIDEANAKTNEMMIQAEKAIEREKEKAVAEMKSHIAMLALLAAEKILEKSIEVEGQDQIINTIIEQAGMAKWQN